MTLTFSIIRKALTLEAVSTNASSVTTPCYTMQCVITFCSLLSAKHAPYLINCRSYGMCMHITAYSITVS